MLMCPVVATKCWVSCSNWLGPFLRLLVTRAPEQDDTKKERHDEWDSRNSDNKTGTGVPWRRERSRVRIVEASDQEEQQGDPTHDHEYASSPAPQPLDSTEGSRKRDRREIGQKARNKKENIENVIQRAERLWYLPRVFLSEEHSERESIPNEIERATEQ